MLEPVDGNVIYQGDIVKEFEFINLAFDEKTKTSTMKSFTGPGILITQTCDVKRRKFLLFAPIFNIESYITTLKEKGKSENNIKGELSQLKNQKVFYYFYVESNESLGVEEGYVDLTFLNPYERIQTDKLEFIARLKDYDRHVLAYKLGNMFMRPH